MTRYYVIIFLLSLFSVWPFFNDGYFKSHDGEWMLIRFTAFHQSLSEGHSPVRITKRLNNNYGYPVLNFLYPGPFYLAEIPKVLGLSFIASIKLIFVTTTIGSALLMFWALSKKFTALASFIGSMVYLFAPYRFVDIYARGSLGENTAFFTAPIILGSIFAISKGSKIFFPILSLSVAFLLISHNVVAVLFLPIFTVICAIHLPRRDFFRAVIYIALGCVASAFFTIPALLDLRYVRLSEIQIADATEHLVSISKLIFPSWGYGANPNSVGGISTQLGIVPIISLLAGAYISIRGKKRDPIILFLILVFLTAIFLMLNISKAAWETLPLIDTIQFPWRLLSITVLVSAILSAFVVEHLKGLRIVVFFVILSMASTVMYAKPVGFNYQPDSYYSTNEDTTTVKNEYLPIWVQKIPEKRADTLTAKNANINILGENLHALTYKATLEAKDNTQLIYNMVYYPGFKAILDSQNTDISYDNPGGLISIKLPKGVHEVIIYYGKTTVHLVSELISILALTLTLILIYKQWRKQNF